MSGGKKEDAINTIKQLEKPSPHIDGKNWLRHRVDCQSGYIDEMILEGKYSTQEIAELLDSKFKPELPIKTRMRRVENHLLHLQDGDSWNRSSGMKPHRLRLVEVNGKWNFSRT